MRADEYVVAELVATKEENEHLKESNHFLREEIRVMEKELKAYKSLFAVEETITGYKIVVKDIKYDLTYALVESCLDQELFDEWLEKLCLELPKSDVIANQEIVLTKEEQEQASEIIDSLKGETND